MRSTLTGKTHGIPLDEQKLESLQTVLRQAVYPELTAEVFKAGFWSQCKNAIANKCKSLRQARGKKAFDPKTETF